MLVVAGATADRPADVPIGGMEKFQLVLTSREAGKRVLRLAARHCKRLRGPGRPGREWELEDQWNRQFGLSQQHRSRFEDGGPLALHRRKESVLLAGGLGGVEPAHHPDRAVGDDAALNLAGGLLGSDQDHPEAATALGDIEQDLLDRAIPFPRRVLVELVEHQEEKLGRLPGALLVLERLADRDADCEALGPIVEVVEVDDRDLAIELDPVLLGVGLIAADQPLDMPDRALQTTNEGVDGSTADGGPCPHRCVILALHLLSDQVDEVAEGPRFLAFQTDPTITNGDHPPQLNHHAVDDHRVLGAIVFGVGKQKRQQILVAELFEGPEEGRDSG